MRGPSANILNNRESPAGRDCSPFGSRSLALSRFRAPQYNACVVMLVSGTHIARAACKARAKRSRSGQTWCHLGRGRVFRQRPYSVEYTRSHPNSEVKLQKARSVLGWGTAWEALRVLLAFCGSFSAGKGRQAPSPHRYAAAACTRRRPMHAHHAVRPTSAHKSTHGGTRTRNLPVRSRTLCPIEPRGQYIVIYIF